MPGGAPTPHFFPSPATASVRYFAQAVMTLRMSSILLLLWIPALVSSSPANVTVQANDPTLVYAGTGTSSASNMYGSPKNIFTLCQEYVTAATDTAGNSVSLNFTGESGARLVVQVGTQRRRYSINPHFAGTSISYTFLQDHDGSTAQILIDGKQVDAVNTYNSATEADVNCVQITQSVAVSSGSHIITAVNQVGNSSQFVMYFLNFA